MSRELTPQETAERSLIKKYRKELWNPFIAAVKRYELIVPGDRIAVCISGGKDSMVLAKLMQELQRHTDRPFELTYLVMDPGYRPENRALIASNAELLGIPCAADARRIETEDGGLQVLRQWKDQKIRVRVKLPCMVTVGLGSNQVILPTLRSQMKANKREIPELTNAELGLDPESIGKRGAKSLVTDTYARGGSQHHAQMLTGSAGEIAAQIKALIEEASK